VCVSSFSGSAYGASMDGEQSIANRITSRLVSNSCYRASVGMADVLQVRNAHSVLELLVLLFIDPIPVIPSGHSAKPSVVWRGAKDVGIAQVCREEHFGECVQGGQDASGAPESSALFGSPSTPSIHRVPCSA
jgi:hypothetical protein